MSNLRKPDRQIGTRDDKQYLQWIFQNQKSTDSLRTNPQGRY
jgi:hypothetical protein